MTQRLTPLRVTITDYERHKLWRMTDEQRRRGPAATQVGPMGDRVRMNVAELRKARGLTTYQLAKRLAVAGRPIPQSGVSRIESGARRVDVDDLAALAVALGVSPNALLLPPADVGRAVQLTPETAVTWAEAWRWARGVGPLPAEQDPAAESLPDDFAGAWNATHERSQRFRRENRGPVTTISVEEAATFSEELRPVTEAARRAVTEGVAAGKVLAWVEEIMLREMMREEREKRDKPAAGDD